MCKTESGLYICVCVKLKVILLFLPPSKKIIINDKRNSVEILTFACMQRHNKRVKTSFFLFLFLDKWKIGVRKISRKDED